MRLLIIFLRGLLCPLRASTDEGIRPAISDCWADSFVKALFPVCLYSAISGLHAAIPGCLRSGTSVLPALGEFPHVESARLSDYITQNAS